LILSRRVIAIDNVDILDGHNVIEPFAATGKPTRSQRWAPI